MVMRLKSFILGLTLTLGLQTVACSPPTNFSIVWKFDNCVTFSLNNGGGSHHQISISPTLASGGGVTSVHRFSGNTTTITGLLPNTSYTAFVRDSCTNGSLSTWVGPLAFTTSCAALSAPWSENFDGSNWTPAPFNQAGVWPNCWTRASANTGLSFVTGPPPFNSFNTGPSDDHSTGSVGQYVYLDAVGFSGTGTSAQFITPILDLKSLSLPEFSFWYHAFGNQISGSQLHLIDSVGSATLLWSSIGQQQFSQSSQWAEVVIDLSPFSNKKIQLRFTGTATSPIAFFSQLAFDDLDVHETPPCSKPTGLTALSVNHHLTTVSWAGGSGPWKIKYGPTGFNPTINGMQITANTVPFTIPNLLPNTNYDIYIKDSCGIDSVSLWSSGISIETSCSPFLAPIQEDFESTQWTIGAWPNLAGTIDPCWNRSPGNSFNDYYWVPGTGATQSPLTGPFQGINNGKYLFTAGWGGGINPRALLTTPWIDASALTIPLLRFYCHLYGSNIDKLQVFADTGTGWNLISNILPTQSSPSSIWTLNEIT
jgi:hypothetical protein